jgi:hypothetical protein
MWKRRRSEVGDEFEGRLRKHRVEPSIEFVEGLSQRVLAERPSAQRAWSRLAFAGAVSTFILGTFASFGGLGYAASGATGTYHAVKQVATKHTLIVSVNKSSAADEYPPKPKPHKTQPPAAVAGVAQGQLGVNDVKTSGTLPFTGLSLLATLVLSLALIASGIALRRRERRN